MPSTAAPFGLQAVTHPSGSVRPEALTIASAYNTGILLNRPVKIGTDGTIQAAAAGERMTGTFAGCEYTDTLGIRQYSPQWIANTVATEIVAYFTRDPNIRYEIQASGTIAQTDIGSQADLGSATAGSTVTGLSAATLDQSTLTSSSSAGFRIVGFGQEVNNAVGDAFTNVIVEISEHQDVADRIAY